MCSHNCPYGRRHRLTTTQAFPPAFPPVITTPDFTPVQPKPPVPMQAFSLVVDVQDVITPAQSKPPDSKNQSQGRSTTHECHNWVCSPSHRLVGVGHCFTWQVTRPPRLVTSYLCRPLLHMSE